MKSTPTAGKRSNSARASWVVVGRLNGKEGAWAFMVGSVKSGIASRFYGTTALPDTHWPEPSHPLTGDDEEPIKRLSMAT